MAYLGGQGPGGCNQWEVAPKLLGMVTCPSSGSGIRDPGPLTLPAPAWQREGGVPREVLTFWETSMRAGSQGLNSLAGWLWGLAESRGLCFLPWKSGTEYFVLAVKDEAAHGTGGQ